MPPKRSRNTSRYAAPKRMRNRAVDAYVAYGEAAAVVPLDLVKIFGLKLAKGILNLCKSRGTCPHFFTGSFMSSLSSAMQKASLKTEFAEDVAANLNCALIGASTTGKTSANSIDWETASGALRLLENYVFKQDITRAAIDKQIFQNGKTNLLLSFDDRTASAKALFAHDAGSFRGPVKTGYTKREYERENYHTGEQKEEVYVNTRIFLQPTAAAEFLDPAFMGDDALYSRIAFFAGTPTKSTFRQKKAAYRVMMDETPTIMADLQKAFFNMVESHKTAVTYTLDAEAEELLSDFEEKDTVIYVERLRRACQNLARDPKVIEELEKTQTYAPITLMKFAMIICGYLNAVKGPLYTTNRVINGKVMRLALYLIRYCLRIGEIFHGVGSGNPKGDCRLEVLKELFSLKGRKRSLRWLEQRRWYQQGGNGKDMTEQLSTFFTARGGIGLIVTMKNPNGGGNIRVFLRAPPAFVGASHLSLAGVTLEEYTTNYNSEPDDDSKNEYSSKKVISRLEEVIEHYSLYGVAPTIDDLSFVIEPG